MSGLINQKEIRVIGFDLDGTLYPSTPEIQARIRKRIYEKISELAAVSFEKACDDFERLYAQYHSGGKALREILGDMANNRDIVQEAMQEADILKLIHKNPALKEMFARLSRTKSIDLLTGSEYEFAIKKLERVGLERSDFEIVLSTADGSKTSGELYEKWIAARNINAGQILYVGDNKTQDIDVPKRLGIRTCILGEYNQADFQIRNILELESLSLS